MMCTQKNFERFIKKKKALCLSLQDTLLGSSNWSDIEGGRMKCTDVCMWYVRDPGMRVSYQRIRWMHYVLFDKGKDIKDKYKKCRRVNLLSSGKKVS